MPTGTRTTLTSRERQVLNMMSECPAPCKFLVSLPDGRFFIKIEQRLNGDVSFERTWAEYERGFGDQVNFWIGLSKIHLLSRGGATLRIELTLWNGSEVHFEYAGFTVGSASTNYTMTYQKMLSDRSSVPSDSLQYHNGNPFSTKDKNNLGDNRRSCSNYFGKGGWWFAVTRSSSRCYAVYLNGRYPTSGARDYSRIIWYFGRQQKVVREVRLLLQV